MKLRKILIAVVCLAVFVSIPVWGAITGSEHDFSGKSWSGGEICIVCHTPHNADTSVAGAPLWNHEVTVATFTLYSGPGTLNATDMGQPAGVSKLCLSCHDGTVALDSFSGSTGSEYMTGSELLGTDLSNDHPISFTYDAALATADGGLFDPTTQSSGLGGTIDVDLLMGNKLECSSCHDVHDKYGNSKLLVVSNAGSALCMTCHDK